MLHKPPINISLMHDIKRNRISKTEKSDITEEIANVVLCCGKRKMALSILFVAYEHKTE